ncbi:MAG: hypothetical protein NTX76_03270 [Alphaproteobacteria bacterium]|nr:hypothetical protein [Alphaproteobacteria bacterium]
MKTLTTAPAEPSASLPVTVKKIPSEPDLPQSFLQPVSVSISENAPLKSIFIELARQANVDLQLDPNINNAIIFSAHQKPFIQVIESICNLAGLRYKIIDQSLKIEIDQPYAENYSIQFLNLSRNSQNKISIATDVFSNTNSQKAAIDNGSNSAVTVTGNNDFWTELEGNLKILLGQNLNSDSGTATHNATYSLHKQGGIITIHGTAKQQKLVSSYLDKLRKAVTSQVLIEAKIIEVTLTDEFKSGVDWKKIGNRGDWYFNGEFGALAKKGHFIDPTSAHADMISLGAKGQTFSAILNALQEFGSSRTLSSPRLTVMNNQTAILKVAQNQVYFRLNYDKQYSANVQRENTSVSSDIQTVPIGLVMSVQPSIDHETGEVILFLRPTVSRMTRSVADPAVSIAYNANVSNTTNTSNLMEVKPSLIPVVEVKEIDSVLRLKNEEIAVLGGLMEVRSRQDTTKLPVLGDIVKDLFSAHMQGDEVVELVILLQVKILETASAPDAADQRLIRSYVPDPRPFPGAAG